MHATTASGVRGALGSARGRRRRRRLPRCRRRPDGRAGLPRSARGCAYVELRARDGPLTSRELAGGLQRPVLDGGRHSLGRADPGGYLFRAGLVDRRIVRQQLIRPPLIGVGAGGSCDRVTREERLVVPDRRDCPLSRNLRGQGLVGYRNCLEPLGRTGQGQEQLPGHTSAGYPQVSPSVRSSV